MKLYYKILVSLLIGLFIICILNNITFAYTNKNADEAINWCASVCGQKNLGGTNQCVAFICAYFEALGSACPRRNSKWCSFCLV